MKNIPKSFTKSNLLRQRANRLIPGGAHTYSKGDDQFPELSPHSLVRGQGARVWDVDGNEFVDWGMGLSSVILGHAYEPVIEAIRSELSNGSNFIRPSYLEAELAELMANQIPCAEMVKFAKNGSDAVTAAVRLARAFTQKDIILRCEDHPFFSVHDWFIGDTVVNSGVPKSIQELTKRFKFNDLQSVKAAIDANEQLGIACLVLQPADTVEPEPGFLQALRDLCDQKGIVLIFDEVVTGFRFHPKGAQTLYGVKPDIACFGKAMANGFSISALAGKREIMRLGGLEHEQPRVFLLSTTYGGETHHLRAAMKTIELLNRNSGEATEHLWTVGRQMIHSFNSISKAKGLSRFALMEGIPCRPHFSFLNSEGKPDATMRTLFVQEMIKCGVLVQGLIPSFSHREAEIQQTIQAFEWSLNVLADGIKQNSLERLLVGKSVKPVFRKFN